MQRLAPSAFDGRVPDAKGAPAYLSARARVVLTANSRGAQYSAVQWGCRCGADGHGDAAGERLTRRKRAR